MRFRTRAFLICFIPFALLLSGSFWMIQRVVQFTVRDRLRTSLKENQSAIARIHSKSDLQDSRFLRVAGENPSLKAGIQLVRTHAGNEGARRTVEDQLRELGEHMGFDFLLVSAPDGSPLAAVVRDDAGAGGHGQLVPVDNARLSHDKGGMLEIGGRTFQVASIPIDQSDENIGSLSVGEYFDFSEFTTPAVLVHAGKVTKSNIPDVSFGEMDTALTGCSEQAECDVKLRGDNWISLPMQTFGDGYVLRSLEDMDKATGPVQARLHSLFMTVGLMSVLLAFACSIASSRSIVRPIATVVSHLRNAVRTGALPEFEGRSSSILEVRELADSYNRAAVSVRTAGLQLEAAYLEFVGSLANALDARDRYTAGHSWRVSRLSCAIAVAMNLGHDAVERICVGALLHDMGKIGIADSVLQKPGRLTAEEFAIVKEHPVIGRRILEGVKGLAPFLGAVELHHENWDGSGYPKGQRREETPIDARIIHVADAYDAMTTNRSYRQGLTHERALKELRDYAGRQFDPEVVEVFAKLPQPELPVSPPPVEVAAEQWSGQEELVVMGAG
jgi:HD-GYP domain-containing protein (c-di-GMP phosphodiesterase class II)